MLFGIFVWFSTVVLLTNAALQCEWERRNERFLSLIAHGQRGKTWTTLLGAQTRCLELGNSCGGVTLESDGYTVRLGTYFYRNAKSISWRKECPAAFRVFSVTPDTGSRSGGTRVTITGQGFSVNQFGYDDRSLGNKVVFYHPSEDYPSVPCNVLAYYTSSTRIVCDVAKPSVHLIEDQEYRLKISVDGTWMEPIDTKIYCGSVCTKYFREQDTPYINSVGTAHAPAGSVMEFGGRIYSSKFEAEEGDDADDSSYISRIYVNSLVCQPLDANGTSYGTIMDLNSDGEAKDTGTIKCRAATPGPTSYTFSFFNSYRGRSEVRSIYKVDSKMQKYAVQTYNEIESINPVTGSTEGGTKITITSQYVNTAKKSIKVQVGGSICEVDSFTSTEIVCTTSKVSDKSFYPGNRGVQVEYWNMEAGGDKGTVRGAEVDTIRDFSQDAANFAFEKWSEDTKPPTLYDYTPNEDYDYPYYVRMKFYVAVPEKDLYGFHMITEHSGKLYVSTDDTRENAVLLSESTSRSDNWNTLQTDVDISLEPGKFYYVEFVGVMSNLKQKFGVGMTKKTTPFKNYEMSMSRIEYPSWKWEQTYSDEVQVIDLAGLIKNPATGFKLQFGDGNAARETTTLYASSSVETIVSAITDTAVYKCPTLDAADTYYDVGFEDGGGFARNDIEPYCGRWASMNSKTLFIVDIEDGVYEWDAKGKYKYLCFALKTVKTNPSLYYELKYQDSDYNWQTLGSNWRIVVWRRSNEWSYRCVNMFKRVTVTDWNELGWDSKIGSRRWSITKVLIDPGDEDYYTDVIIVTTEDIATQSENSRVKAFPLDGNVGMFKSVVVEITDYCDNGTDCTGSSEATTKKWHLTMDGYGCTYNFPLIAIASKTETVVNADKSTYVVGGNTVTIERTSAITKELMGTFDLSIDGVTHTDIPVQIHQSKFLEMIRKNGLYTYVHKLGTCYNRYWRLQRTNPGHHGWHSINSTKIVGADVTATTMFRDNERGGLVLTPLYGDWIRTVESTPQVTVTIDSITALCNKTSSSCDFAPSADVTPTVSSVSPTSGTTGQQLSITGLKFGTDKSKVTVTIGSEICTMVSTTDTLVVCTVTNNVASTHADLLVHVDGVGNAKNAADLTFTYEGSITSFNPSSGSKGGGTLVTIVGKGFDKDASGVTFGGIAGTIKSATFTEIQVVVPAGAAAASTAVVVTGGSDFIAPTTTSQFTYITSGIAKINSVSPNYGPVVGGTEVTLNGENIQKTADNGVTIGGAPCIEVSKSTTQYVCTTGENTPGTKEIVLETTADGNAETSNTFTYKLEIHGITPEQGSVVGGTVLTITGSGFGTNASMVAVNLGQYDCHVVDIADDELMCRTEPASYADYVMGECALQDTDIPWGGIGSLRVADLEACFQACRDVEACASITYQVSPPYCYTKNRHTGTAFAKSGYISGYKRCFAVTDPICVGLTLNSLEQTIQDVHNMYRSRHTSTKHLCYSKQLAVTAASWATYMADMNKFRASSSSFRNGHGENIMLYEDYSLKSDEAYMRDAITAWYSGISSYMDGDVDNALFFTQVVWRLTTKVGCFINTTRANSSSPYKIYIVCHYSPGGNYSEGRLEKTVGDLDPKRKVATAALTSQSTPVSLFVKTHKAVKTSGSTASGGGCTPVTGNVAGCSGNTPTPTGADIDYAYYTCRTPTITTVTKQVPFNGEITITGNGFTTRKCAITVMLGSQHGCTVKTASADTIVCIPDVSTEPTIHTRFKVSVNILGRGDAIFSGQDYTRAFTSLTPKITSISPTKGSGQGGTTIEINGGGFKYSERVDRLIPGRVSDGTRDLQVISATYTRITVQNTGVGDIADGTIKEITLWQDRNLVECDDTVCDFTYEVTETATVTSIEPLIVAGPTTITIDGANLCVDGAGTSVSVGDAACTVQTCTTSQITCDLDIPAGAHKVVMILGNGYANIPKEFSVITCQFTFTSVEPIEGSVYGGTTVTIIGTGFRSTPKVKTNSYEWVIKSSSATEIVAETINREVSEEEIDSIRIHNGSNWTESGFSFTYKPALSPTVTRVYPVEDCWDGQQADYRGYKNTTKSGRTCQKWTSQSPRSHSKTHNNYPNSGLGDHNYCRNPDGESETWCYTVDDNTRFETCGVKRCDSGTLGDEINITGENLIHPTESDKTAVFLGEDTECVVKTAIATQIVCTLGDSLPGVFDVKVVVEGVGNSNSNYTITYNMVLTSTTPSSPSTGLQGGPTISINGAGFSEDNTNVKICGLDVDHIFVSAQELTVQLPHCPENICVKESTTCHLTVRSGSQYRTLANKVQYESDNTPNITNIDPDNAGTGGGKSITISGSGFSDSPSSVVVKFDGVECAVDSSTTTQIQCTTGAKADLANKEGVEVRIDRALAANPDSKEMKYCDKWSSRYTWGNQEPPIEGDMAVIKKGQIIYLDISTPVLRAILIRGGSLIFEDSDDITLKAEYILILDNGSLHIGSETAPFQHDAVIEMYGQQHSTELPLYGAKTLAVRHGTVEMHGKPVTPTWTELDETASKGDTEIVIGTTTNWKIGDLLAISSSSFSPTENEEFTITSLSETGDKTTIGLSGELQYDHISITQNIRGVEIKTAAKVGHLTRNVKMRGNVNEGHVEGIDVCGADFDPEQFAGQSCFQGRYGTELDSDQFGSQIMFHAAAMETREVHGMLEYTEFTWAGQAFRLGRYPIHFHMNGDVSGSYVKGCAIHHTFNRAVTVHGVDNLLVQNNVAFNNLGHAFFLEDGGEENNVFDRNLAIFTRSSSSLLNVDVTPASFWIVNPVNRFTNNVAAGGTHFGFWFNMPVHPGGPSATDTVCPRNKGMLEFSGNEAHSQGRYGIWIWENWAPKGSGSCDSTVPAMTTLSDFHAWHNQRGIEIAGGSGIQLDNFLLHDNWFAQVEVHECAGATFEQGNTKIINSQIFSKTASSDGLGMNYNSQEVFQCGVGAVMPKTGMFSVLDTTFHDFTECAVFEACGSCRTYQGGFPCEFSGITYHNSPIKGSFQWQYEVILRDLDGSLAGTVGGIVTPDMEILDPAECTKNDEWSHGAVDGASCSANVNLIRMAWNEPSTEFLKTKSVNISNSHGTTQVPWMFMRITHPRGWMATIPTGDTYSFQWDTEHVFTNASYKAAVYYPKQDDYFILEQTLKDSPDYVSVGGKSNKKLSPIEPSDDLGTFHFDNDTKILSYIVTGKGITDTRALPLDVKVHKCFFENCANPNPTPLSYNPSLDDKAGRTRIRYWSRSEDWADTEEGYGGFGDALPKAGDTIIIPASWWMIYDVSMAGFDKIFVYGVLEFTDKHDTMLGAKAIIVIGGKLVVGWADAPLRVNVNIVLTGQRSDSDYMLGYRYAVGSKALAIFGFAEIHSEHPDVVWSTITERAPAGATSLKLQEDVEEQGWKGGDEIVIASTSFLGTEAEKRTIKSVTGHTVELTVALDHDHDYQIAEIEGHIYKRTAEVGLLTRYITIEGAVDTGHGESYGARVLVSDYQYVSDETRELVEFIPVAKIQGVRFKNSGQQGYRDAFDPRYSLAFRNTDPTGDKSYIKGCSIDNGFNHGIGIYGSHNVDVVDNVVFTTLGSGIITNSENTNIEGNLVMNVLQYGNYMTPPEEDNYLNDACFDTQATDRVTLRNNHCAGSEKCGYVTRAEPLDSSTWEGNVAHSTVWGFFIMQKGHGSVDVVKLNKVLVWQNYDYGIVHWSKASLVIQNSILADNWRSVLPLVIGPDPLSHIAEDKYVAYNNTLIYGRNPTSACDERANNQPLTAMRTGLAQHDPPGANGGRLGIYLSNFYGKSEGWPKMAIQQPTTYTSIKGYTYLSDVTVANFNRCKDIFLMDLPDNADCFHPTSLSGMTYQNVDMDTGLLKQNDPFFANVNPTDCVDMPCDAKKKILIVDTDGSTFGEVTSLTSKSEFQWDGDAKWGVGDARLPNQMTTAADGSFISPDTWPYKGIDRNADTACKFSDNLNMYKCTGVTYRMLVVESLDGDTEIRRLSPVALSTDDGSIDLINGPMDHGWCGGYTCQQRISTFYGMVIVGKVYKLHMSSTQPQSLRYYLIGASNTDKIRIDTWYAKPQRLDLYYDGAYKPPTNAMKKADGTYSYATDKTAEELYPKITSNVPGENFFDSTAKYMSILIIGPKPYTVRTSPRIVISLSLEAVTVDEFFGKNIIANLAALLNIPKERIRIAEIVSEGGRKRATGITRIQIIIDEPPVEAEEEMNDTKSAELADELTVASEKFVDVVQKGTLSDSLNVQVAAVTVKLPEAPPADRRNETINKEEAEKSGGTTIAEKQKEEEEEKAADNEEIAVLIPNKMVLVSASESEQNMLSNVTVKSKVVTQSGEIVPLLGTGDGTWRATLSIVRGPKQGRILGAREVQFKHGYSNFADIRMSRMGIYTLKLAVTHPVDFSYEIPEIKLEIVSQDNDSPLARVMFLFDGDYDTVITDSADFTNYLTSELSTKFPNIDFRDIDHYKDSTSIVVEVTVSSASKEETKNAIGQIKATVSSGYTMYYQTQPMEMLSFSNIGSCVEWNYEYQGANIRRAEEVLSLEECMSLCYKENNCVSVSHKTSTKECWLKNKRRGDSQIVLNGVHSVGLFCLAGLEQSCIRKDYEYEGGDIRLVGDVEMIEDCVVLCQTEDDCVSVTHSPATKDCWLKRKRNGANPGPLVGVNSVNLLCSGRVLGDDGSPSLSMASVLTEGCVKKDFDFYGADILGSGGVTTIEECAALCQDKDGCVSIAHEPAGNGCWLKYKRRGAGTRLFVGVNSVDMFCIVSTMQASKYNIVSP